MQGPALGLRLISRSSAGADGTGSDETNPDETNPDETNPRETVPRMARPQRAAVLGRPIAHSLSPALHRAAYDALGLRGWTYEAIDCGAEELPALVGASGPEWAGFSVTMPGKRAALAFAGRRSPEAELVGAANTLLAGAHGWSAANTDVDGIEGALAGRGVDLATAGTVLLGAGGTAQAAVVAAARSGAGSIEAVVREPARATELRDTAERAGIELTVHRFESTAADALLDSGRAVISTLPAHAADALATRVWATSTVLLDAVYANWPTALARAVTAAGGVAVNGTEMLLYQAAAQVRLMTGRDAPLQAMRAALPG